MQQTFRVVDTFVIWRLYFYGCSFRFIESNQSKKNGSSTDTRSILLFNENKIQSLYIGEPSMRIQRKHQLRCHQRPTFFQAFCGRCLLNFGATSLDCTCRMASSCKLQSVFSFFDDTRSFPTQFLLL